MLLRLKFLALLTVLFDFLKGCARTGDSSFQVKIFKIGKADCSLISVNGLHILIDTGEEEDVVEILRYLDTAEITCIDILIITHFDKDHVGGAAHILNQLSVKEVLVPNYTSDSKQMKTFFRALKELGIQATVITEKLDFSIGEAKVTVLPPLQTFYDDDNNYSLVTSILYGETSYLFTGDAEAERLDELLNDQHLAHTFLKVPHHGRFNKQTKAFFSAVQPEIAVITASKKNPPDNKTISALQAIGADIYITQNGTVTLTSDGHLLSVKQ